MVDVSLPLFFLIFVLAGMVKGVTGMGLPTVAMGLLATVAAPHEAVSLMLLPSLATNIWQFATGSARAETVRRFWPMMTMVAVGAVTTAGVLTGPSAHLAVLGLGGVLVAYALFGLAGRKLPSPAGREAWISPPVGLVTGAITGATGVAVMPAAPYFQSLDLDKDRMVQALGLSFTVSTLALGVGLALNGALTAPHLGGSLLALVPAAIGMALGQALRDRIDQKTFRTVFFAGMLALGVHLVFGG